MNEMSKPAAAIKGEEHWTTRDGGVKLFLFEKCAGDPAKTRGTILFVHGSSMASQPTFDLQVPGRPNSSAMDHFARLGFDCWCVDMEGYGRSTKDRDNNAPDFARRRRLLRRRPLYPEAARQTTLPGVRHFLGRAARRDVCGTASRDGGASCARCHGLDRRRLAHARAAPQEASRISGKEPPPDRQGFHPFSVRSRPSGHRRTQGD